MCTKTTQTRLFCFPQKSSVAFLPAKRLFARSQRGKKDAIARQFVRRHKSQSSLVVSSARASKPAPAAAPSRARAGPVMKSPASPSPRRAPRPLACVDPGASLGSILSTLHRHDVLSAPVIEKSKDGRYHGFVDVAEILGYLVRACARWLDDEFDGAGTGTEKPASVPTQRFGVHPRPSRPVAVKESLGILPAVMRDELYSAKDEADVLWNLQSTLGEGMFKRTLRAARVATFLFYPLEFRGDVDGGDGETIYKGARRSLLRTRVAFIFRMYILHQSSPPSLTRVARS